MGTGRQQQLVERQFLAAVQFDDMILQVDRRRLNAQHEPHFLLLVPTGRMDRQVLLADLPGQIAGQIEPVIGKLRFLRDERDLCRGRSRSQRFHGGNPGNPRSDNHNFERLAGGLQRHQPLRSPARNSRLKAPQTGTFRGRLKSGMNVSANQASPLADAARRGSRRTLDLRLEQVRRRTANRTRLGRFRSAMDVSANGATPRLIRHLTSCRLFTSFPPAIRNNACG